MTQGARTVALIVAAGRGERAGGELPKQYQILGGKTLLAHAIRSLQSHSAIDVIRVVIGEDQQALYQAATEGFDLPAPSIGGAERRLSVRNGLDTIAAEGGAARILIHDAARPFVPAAVIDRLLEALDAADGAIPALPIADTLVRAGPTIGETVPRDGLLRVQTPQAFRFDALADSHSRWPDGEEATDDAQMVRRAGYSVVAVEGDRMLDKITYPADFASAEQRLSAQLVSRTGSGFDVHSFTDSGSHVRIGGIDIAHDRALAGHSDADVALHALTDALLGTISDGDIGTHFPPSDPQWRGADSARFLEHARDLVLAKGGHIDHVDLTIICEAPKVGPHRGAIRARIATLLRLPESRVSIKATTTERLGFTGRREGIAAQALATVRLPEDL